jgi:hypothetical protein
VSLDAGVFLFNVIGVGMGMQGGMFAAPDTIVELDGLVGVSIFPEIRTSRSCEHRGECSL